MAAFYRRRFLKQGLAAGLALPGLTGAAVPGPATAEPVVVLTAYADEVLHRFEAAFERAHPDHRLQLVWRMPHDALPYLQGGNPHGIDVLWMASPRTFHALAQADMWQPLKVDHRDLPDCIGGARLAAPDDAYVATEMAAYGFAVHPESLARLGAPTPRDWTDLTDPRLAGQIAMPVPSVVGFAPVMMDIVLQAWGWEAGWAVLGEIGGNARLMDRGSTFVSDEVGTGRAAVGLSIDFFVQAAVANGAPLRFAYPRHGGINPGHVGILRQAPHPVGARAFVEFVLSDVGQRLLLDPDIRKMPVRPSVYRAAGQASYNPFQAAKSGGLDYAGERTQGRLGVVSALFDALITANHGEWTALWQRVHTAELAGRAADVAAARRALEAAPLTEAEAELPSIQSAFQQLEGAQAQASALRQHWRAQCQRAREQARVALDQAHA